MAVVVVAALAASGPAGAAERRPPLERIGTLPAEARLTDRFIAYQTAPDALRIRDVVARSIRDVPLGRPCKFESARYWLALLGCEAWISDSYPFTCVLPYVVILGTGEARYVRMRDPPTRWDCDPYNEYQSVGLHWLAGGQRQWSPHPSAAYLNWRTGEARHSSPESDGGATYDLDDPQLAPRTSYAGPAEGDARVVVSEVPGDPILLRRRGRRTVVLSRCRAGCSLPGLAGGRVVWREGRREVRAYVVRTGRRWSWRLPVPAAGSWSEWTITTRWATLVTVHGDRGNPAYVIRWAR